MHYVEIGNEDWFDRSGSYDARFTQFFDAIKAKYPQLKCISTVGTEQPESKRVHSRQPDVLDEHYYRSARTFLNDSAHFDNYDRKGPEIFVGEWAAYETSFPPWNGRSAKEPPTADMTAALGDATWMTAMERNSDLVKMQCYAPLLVNVNPGARQWRPDLIGYDTLHCYGSPSYYAFKMFSRNVGDEILKASLDDATAPLFGDEGQQERGNPDQTGESPSRRHNRFNWTSKALPPSNPRARQPRWPPHRTQTTRLIIQRMWCLSPPKFPA